MPFTFISNFIDDGGEYTVPKGAILFYPHNATSPPAGFSFLSSGTNKYCACGSTYGAEGGSTEHRHHIGSCSVAEAEGHSHAITGESTKCSAIKTVYDAGRYTITLSNPSHRHPLREGARSDVSGNHTHSFTSSYTSYAGNYPKNKGLRTIQANADNTPLPVGAIIMSNKHSFSKDNRFALCDGTNGTPDFRGLLVTNSEHDFGGTDSHNHTPPSLSSAGAHSHHCSGMTMASAISTVSYEPWSSGGLEGSHSHTFDFNTDSSGTHTHSVTSPLYTNRTLVPSINLYFFKYLG